MLVDKQFCSVCGIVLSEVFYKCGECGQITCPACQNKDKRCCIDCAPVESSDIRVTRKTNPAFVRPMNLTPQLEAIVGEGPMPRTEVTKRLWIYIKERGLQESTNRRMINADEKLAAVFGDKKQVSMFEMTTLVAQHISK